MNIAQKKDQLLSLMRRPKAPRKPSNFALWWAYAFYNLVAFFLDAITAYTVYTLTNALYAGLTFFAGFMPLLMHEFLFMRAYASKTQRGIAIIGAIVSVLAIVVIGLAAGAINVIGLADQARGLYLELGVISLIVLISAGHGLLAAIYFYIDEGIRFTHNQAEAIAYHDQQLANLELAHSLAEKVQQAATKEDDFIGKFGDRELLEEAMSQITGARSDQTPPSSPATRPIQPYPKQETEAAELYPVPLPVGFSGNGNGHKPK